MTLTVFLDFDGVLHPAVCTSEQLFLALPLIEGVLRPDHRVEIVISSDWRHAHSIDKLRQFFSPDMHARIVGVTPVVSALSTGQHYQRQAECELWLRQHRPANASWLAIDDWPDGFGPKSPRLLVTDHHTGFTTADAKKLTALIEEFSNARY